MSFSEHSKRLEQSFRTTTGLQQSLLRGLQQRRAAWTSVRPGTLAPSPELEDLARQLAREEAVRDELTAAISRFLPAPLGGSSTDLHVNVTRIAAALPPEAARSLREAAQAATDVARSVRTEVTVGQRLLRFSQRVQQSLTGRAVGGSSAVPGAPGYDRQARRRPGVPADAGGSHIDGRI
ncbi:MAG TPA: hypothetical protein VFZ65_11040 [Planctomycetota bacterium]|nr:hypothetical protein [Planctomycetota bacterium]